MNQLIPDRLIEACVCNGIHGSKETIDWLMEKLKEASGVLVVNQSAIWMSGMPVFRHSDHMMAKAAAMEQAMREGCKTIFLEKSDAGLTMREYNGRSMQEALDKFDSQFEEFKPFSFSDSKISFKVKWP